MQDVKFEHKSYREWIGIENALIYCDPPCNDTTQPYGTGEFNTEKFWEDMRELSEANDVYISEYGAPDDFECIWEQEVSRSIKAADKSKSTEKLFKYKEGDNNS